jgi:Tfp pilus assembly protein PilF
MADQEAGENTTLDEVVAEIDDLIADYELDDAKARLGEAFAEFGKLARLQILEAELALEDEAYERCVAVVDEALDEVSGDDDNGYEDEEARARLLAQKGYALYYLDEIEEARKVFNLAVQADGELWTAIVGRAMVHDYLDYLRAAMIDLDRAIEIDDQEGQPFAIRGMIALRWGQLDDARRDLGYAVQSNPFDEESLLNLARLQAIEGNSSAARETLEPLVDEGEDPAFVAPGALLRSQLALGLGSADSAAADALVAIDLLAEEPWGYLALAAAHITGGSGGEAVAALKEAEDTMQNPRDYPDLFALRAAAYDQIGKVDKAKEEHAKAEGSARLPEFVYGGYLNPSRNVPINPDKPVDVRAIMRQIFGDPDQAPEGYEDAVRQVIDQIPQYVEQNPELGRIEVELPQFEGMEEAPGNLVIQLNREQ